MSVDNVKLEIPPVFRTQWAVKLADKFIPVMSCKLNMKVDGPSMCQVVVPYTDAVDDLKPLTPMTLLVNCYDKKWDIKREIALWEGFLVHKSDSEDSRSHIAILQFTDIIGISQYVQSVIQSGTDPWSSIEGIEIIVPEELYNKLDNYDISQLKIKKATKAQITKKDEGSYQSSGGVISFMKAIIGETVEQLETSTTMRKVFETIDPWGSILFLSSLDQILDYIINTKLLTNLLTPLFGQTDLFGFIEALVKKLWDSDLVPTPRLSYGSVDSKVFHYMFVPRMFIFNPAALAGVEAYPDVVAWKDIPINKVIASVVSQNSPLMRPTRLVSYTPKGEAIWVPPFKMNDFVIPSATNLSKFNKDKDITGLDLSTEPTLPDMKDILEDINDADAANNLLPKYKSYTQSQLMKIIMNENKTAFAKAAAQQAYIYKSKKQIYDRGSKAGITIQTDIVPTSKQLFVPTEEEKIYGFLPVNEYDLFVNLNETRAIPEFSNLFAVPGASHTVDDYVIKSYMAIRFLEIRADRNGASFEMPFDPWMIPGFPVRFYRDPYYEEALDYTARAVSVTHTFLPNESTTVINCTETIKTTDDFLENLDLDSNVYWDGVIGDSAHKASFLKQMGSLELVTSETAGKSIIYKSNGLEEAVDILIKEYNDMGIDIPYVTGDIL